MKDLPRSGIELTDLIRPSRLSTKNAEDGKIQIERKTLSSPSRKIRAGGSCASRKTWWPEGHDHHPAPGLADFKRSWTKWFGRRPKRRPAKKKGMTPAKCPAPRFHPEFFLHHLFGGLPIKRMRVLPHTHHCFVCGESNVTA